MAVRAHLHTNGYALVKRALPQPMLDAFTHATAQFVRAEAAHCGAEVAARVAALPADRLPHDGLIALRNHNTEAMRQVVDRLKISAAFMAIIYSAELRALSKDVLALDDEADVLMAHPNMRADLPEAFAEEKRKFSLPWHQEGGYYKTKASLSRSLVMHISQFDCAAHHGALEMKAGSHSAGYVDHNEYFADQTGTKHFRVELPDAALKDYKTVALTSEAGDVGVIDFRTFHRSGVNASDQVRYTFLIRVSPATAPDLAV